METIQVIEVMWVLISSPASIVSLFNIKDCYLDNTVARNSVEHELTKAALINSIAVFGISFFLMMPGLFAMTLEPSQSADPDRANTYGILLGLFLANITLTLKALHTHRARKKLEQLIRLTREREKKLYGPRYGRRIYIAPDK
jgi:hypothetical protein